MEFTVISEIIKYLEKLGDSKKQDKSCKAGSSKFYWQGNYWIKWWQT